MLDDEEREIFRQFICIADLMARSVNLKHQKIQKECSNLIGFVKSRQHITAITRNELIKGLEEIQTLSRKAEKQIKDLEKVKKKKALELGIKES